MGAVQEYNCTVGLPNIFVHSDDLTVHKNTCMDIDMRFAGKIIPGELSYITVILSTQNGYLITHP